MSAEIDDLDALVRDLRARGPSPARAGLAQELMAEFDRTAAPRRLGRTLRRTALAAAAALLIASAALLLRSGGGRSWSEPSERVAVASLRSLRLELAALSAAVAAGPRPAEPPPEPLPEPPPGLAEALGPSVSRTYLAAGQDPALLRLLAAGQREVADPAGARERYQRLLDDYGDGPAAAVARSRLAALPR